MKDYLEIKDYLTRRLKPDQILLNEPMRNHTNFKLGGPADILVLPESLEELTDVLTEARKSNTPYFIIGNGSNLIVKDGGIRGMVVKLERLTNAYFRESRLIAQAGVELKNLSQMALEAAMTGLEFACGIPGSLGGAVFMNAGAYGGEMKDVLVSAKVLTPAGETIDLSKEELELGYRTSIVKAKGYIVLEATMELTPGDPLAIKATIDDLTKRREDKQPLEYPSGGSTFKRPPGYFAGKLIQDAGLKGYEHNGAAVSDKHSGFVINKSGTCRTKDILELIDHVRWVVKESSGQDLETEVLIVGEDER